MKYRIEVILLLAFILFSCSTTKPKAIKTDYEKCLPKTFKNELSLLLNSFNEFVKRNHKGELSSFISAIRDRSFPDKSDFSNSDVRIAEQLRSNNFRDNIYTEYEERVGESGIEIAPPRTAGQTEEPKRTMIKVDIEKSYLKCMKSAPKEGTLIGKYVDLQIENPSLSPLLIGDLFLENQGDKDYGTKTANTIIAVELYYMILDAATDK